MKGSSPLCTRQQHRAVEADARCAFPHFGFCLPLQRGPQADEVVIRKAEQRAQHGGSEIDILRRVVDDPQQCDEGPDVGASSRFSRASA